jgi:hypothetical protein
MSLLLAPRLLLVIVRLIQLLEQMALRLRAT